MLLQLRDIGKIYNSNDILTIGVRNINLEFDYNEFVTIEGESGSGKSTLLNVIAANDSYEEGELLFDGEETSHYSMQDWEKYRENNIAMIFQDFNIIENLTVLENVELALFRIPDISKRKEIAKSLLEKVGLSKQMNHKGSHLSGGEKQRCVIARALAKDSPIILADEPTGNLDSKSSREVARILKEVSKDKLVIVVTHNPEFFKEYATRRVLISDGKLKEDNVIEKPQPKEIQCEEAKSDRKLKVKNMFRLGFLNYKSRPKFSTLMSLALGCIAIALFVVLQIANSMLISPLTKTLDDVGVMGKVIVSNTQNYVEQDTLDEICAATGASYYMYDRDRSEFTITLPKKSDMYRRYDVTCIYDPIHHSVSKNEGLLVIPQSYKQDAQSIVDVIEGASSSITEIDVSTTLDDTQIKLYLSYDSMETNGNKIKALNSTVKIGENETNIYTFEKNVTLEDGQVNLVNSNYYDVKGKYLTTQIASTKIFVVNDDTLMDKSVDGIVVELSSNDYAEIFESTAKSRQSVLYFENDDVAKKALEKLPDGHIGMLSTSTVFVSNVGNVFALDVLYYTCMIVLSIILAAVLFVIFMRSIRIYQSDFAIYKTLGIPSRVSRGSLYVQMILTFLPTLVFLPLVSYLSTFVKSLSMTYISFGNYLFIEILILLIVLFVAYGFNKNMNRSKISQVLRRGSK
jgi:ABC-type lipoprotein export system ATPase subunit